MQHNVVLNLYDLSLRLNIIYCNYYYGNVYFGVFISSYIDFDNDKFGNKYKTQIDKKNRLIKIFITYY